MAALAGLALTTLVACTSSGPATTVTPAAAPATATGAATRPLDEETVTPSAADRALLDADLRAAAWDDDLPRATALVARGADVNAKDDTQQSAYLIATSEGHLGLLRLALAHGARVDDKDSWNGTGLIRAAERGHGSSSVRCSGPASTATTSTGSATRRSTRPSGSGATPRPTSTRSASSWPAVPSSPDPRATRASPRSRWPANAGSTDSQESS